MNTKVFFITAFSIIFATLICAYCVNDKKVSSYDDAKQVFLQVSSYTYDSDKSSKSDNVVFTKQETATIQTSLLKRQKEKTTNTKNVRLGRFKLTAYCSCSKCCGKYANNRPKDKNGKDIVYGASGNRLYPNHSVAVDKKVIPYGSNLIINGHKYVAEDCGGKIKGNKIDVYCSSHKEACDFGVKYADVYMVVN